MCKPTVCESILDVIASADVKQVFGIVGDAINPLVDAIRRDDRMEWIHVRHEEVGAFAASAQAKMTGKLAVCAGTVGPGAIHLLNGLYDAKKDHAPVLALTGQVPRSEVGSDFHQEANLDALFADVSLFNATINVRRRCRDWRSKRFKRHWRAAGLPIFRFRRMSGRKRSKVRSLNIRSFNSMVRSALPAKTSSGQPICSTAQTPSAFCVALVVVMRRMNYWRSPSGWPHRSPMRCAPSRLSITITRTGRAPQV